MGREIVFFLILVGSLIFGGVTSCTKKPVTPANTLRIQVPGDPVSLDPALAEDGLSLQILGNILEGLTATTVEGKTELRQAESIAVSADRRRYQFILKPGLRWSDGSPLQAHHYAEGFRRFLDAKTGARLAPLFDVIQGAQDYRRGLQPFSTVGIKSNDQERSVEFILAKPVPYFPGLLVLPGAYPFPVEKFNANQNRWDETLPTNSQYVIKNWEREKRMLLETNPYSPTPTDPGSRSIELVVVRDESTALRLFESGNLDLLQRVPHMDADQLRKNGKLRTVDFAATYYLAFNVNKNPFQNASARRRIADLFNSERGTQMKSEIVKLLGNGDRVAHSWIPGGLEGFFDHPLVHTAVPRSGGAEADKTFDLGFDASSRSQLLAEKVQADLRTHLGMTIQLQALDWKSYVKHIHTDASPLYRFGWMAPFADPITHLKVFVSGSENNHSGYANKSYDALVEKIDGLSPGPEREKLIVKAQKIILYEDPVVIPIYHYVLSFGVGTRIRQLQVSPFAVVKWSKL